MYRPDSSKVVIKNDFKKYFSAVSLHTSDNLDLLGWYAKSSKNYPTIVYFHGNAGNISDRAETLLPFVKNGLGLLLLSYRGYAGNSGSPSEKGFYRDARAAIEFLIKDIKLSQLIIFGESIGTGVAVQMALEYPTSLLILQSPYTSMVELASLKYPIFPTDLLLKDRYNSINKITKLSQKIIILHGTKDDVIPVGMSEILFEVAKNAELFIEPESNHGNILTNSMINKILGVIRKVFTLESQ
ncbi:MAG: alpha/beta hydrolase [Legionellales bacterium]|nr:alpha/beta hydrolase [Legionellales bacterium]